MNNIERKFKTPLGEVLCGIKFDGIQKNILNKEYQNGYSENIETPGHKIEIIEFKIKMPLYNNDTVTDTCGWIFRIEKTSETKEIIETYCSLNSQEKVEFDNAGGENLDAIEASNGNWILNIGTEDGEVYNSRALNNDWFPPRFRNFDFYYKSIAKQHENGFTAIVDLKKGEKVHLQYLVAYDKNDKTKINTSLAVDQSKESLEKWIGIK